MASDSIAATTTTRRKARDGNYANPSIADFPDKKKLALAMRRGSMAGSVASSVFSYDEHFSSSFGVDSKEYEAVEWTLPLVDQETTEPQTMEEEMKRLEVLNSYFVLDAQGEVVGLDAGETPRKHAFCAHVILNKYKLLVVPDATKDF